MSENLERKRIVYVHGSANMYGASRSLLRLATNMQKQFDVLVVLTQEGPLRIEMARQGIDVQIMPWLHPCVLGRHAFHFMNLLRLVLYTIPVMVRFSFFLRRQKADLLHSNSIVVWTPALSAKLAGVPHIWHVRETLDRYAAMWSRFAETESSIFWRWSTFVLLRMWGLFVRLIYAFASEVVCVSAAARAPFETLNLTQHSRVIHNGIDIDYYRSKDFEPLDLSAYGVEKPDCSLIVGVIGALRRSKGQETAIQAFGEYRKLYPDVKAKLLIAGDYKPENRAYVEHLHELVHRYAIEEDVIFTGYVDDPRTVFARMDLCIVPSIQSEPFGTVVLEAMATETPVIGTSIGGTVEQIEDGHSGLLFAPADVKMLTDALVDLMGNVKKREAIAQAALERIRACFSVELHIQRVQQLYATVLGA